MCLLYSYSYFQLIVVQAFNINDIFFLGLEISTGNCLDSAYLKHPKFIEKHAKACHIIAITTYYRGVSQIWAYENGQ